MYKYRLLTTIFEVREGRPLTLVAGRNKIWYICVLAVTCGMLFAVLRWYRVCSWVGRMSIIYFGESE